MAKQSLQEKFQVTLPGKLNNGEPWADVKTALRPRPASGGYSANSVAHSWQATPEKDMVPRVNKVAASNDPPCWTDMKEDVLKLNGGMKLTTASETDVTNVVYGRDLKNGFCLHDLDSVDDQYTGEGVDHFYSEARGEDDGGNKYTGFIERSNYLDRE